MKTNVDIFQFCGVFVFCFRSLITRWLVVFRCFNNCIHNLRDGIWVVWTYCCFHGNQTIGDSKGICESQSLGMQLLCVDSLPLEGNPSNSSPSWIDVLVRGSLKCLFQLHFLDMKSLIPSVTSKIWLLINITKCDVMKCKGLFYLAIQLCVHEKIWMGACQSFVVQRY